jgi:hypothetical protein
MRTPNLGSHSSSHQDLRRLGNSGPYSGSTPTIMENIIEPSSSYLAVPGPSENNNMQFESGDDDENKVWVQ